MFDNTGEEGNIIWHIKSTRNNIFAIVAIDKDTLDIEVDTYHLLHTPLFGMDVDDARSINERLENVISKLKERM